MWIEGRLARLVVVVDDLVWFALDGSDVAAGMFVVPCWHLENNRYLMMFLKLWKVWYFSQRIGRAG